MSFPRYPAYKDSGVEWLGEVPEHWNVIEARREIAFLTSGSRGWAEYYSEEGPVFLRIGNLTRDSIHIDLEDIQRVNPPPGVEGDRTQVSSGDVLFSITAYLGSVAVVPQGLERAYVSQHVCLARLTGRRLLPEWLAYSVLSSTGKAYLESESYGGTKVQLSLDDIKSFPLPLPSLDEQRALTSLLDRETAKIDALIAEQQRLIELLQEKRQAVISHAVTKGLNPDAPMKDSGVEWLGEVPEHWQCLPLKRYVTGSNAGEVIDKSFWGGSDELLYTCAIEPLWCDYSGFPEWKRTKESDLLLTRNGTPYVHQPVFGSIYTNVVQRITVSPGKNRDYLAVALQNSANNLKGYGVSIESLNYQMWSALPVPFPPLAEQVSILEAISVETEKFDALLTEAKSGIQLLQERRSALISAAVTGQIDVRGLVAEAEAA